MAKIYKNPIVELSDSDIDHLLDAIHTAIGVREKQLAKSSKYAYVQEDIDTWTELADRIHSIRNK